MDRENGPDRSPLSEAEQSRLMASIGRVEQAVNKHLAPLGNSQAVIHWVRQLHSNVETVYDRHVSAGAAVKCSKGCGHCCHIRVEALPPEIFRIATHLQERWAHDPSDKAATLQRLADHPQAMASARSAQEQPACPFLVQQVCSIYEVRPAVCRKGHSLDVHACQTHAPTLPQSLPLLADAEALIQGTSRAYADQGLESGGHDLASGVWHALHDASAQPRWLAGEAVFTGH